MGAPQTAATPARAERIALENFIWLKAVKSEARLEDVFDLNSVQNVHPALSFILASTPLPRVVKSNSQRRYADLQTPRSSVYSCPWAWIFLVGTRSSSRAWSTTLLAIWCFECFIDQGAALVFCQEFLFPDRPGCRRDGGPERKFSALLRVLHVETTGNLTKTIFWQVQLVDQIWFG